MSNPGRVWSFSEVQDLRAKGLSVEEARKMAEMRMTFKASRLWTKGEFVKQKGLF